MNRPLRRKDRAIPEAEALEILGRSEYGVLATVGEHGEPYAVPVNHVLSGDSIYIHCALEGHKLENIAHDARVSYCTVGFAQVLPEQLSTLYESVIIFGRAALVSDEAEKWEALRALGKRFAPGREAETDQAIDRSLPRTAILRIRIDRITGKAHR
jgi:nitroimidazol reductase NimA-like FMN-containing flavoprotein (pyridoxamine 5'-phosphate oxidase superfamily)